MSLFGKKQPELPANFLEDEPEAPLGVDQNSVLDYLLQLTTEDYEKLLKLAKIYREANKKAGELIPQYDPDMVAEQSNTEEVPAHVNHVAPKSKTDHLLLDDDDALDNFLNEALEDDEPKGAKGKKVNVTKKD